MHGIKPEAEVFSSEQFFEFTKIKQLFHQIDIGLDTFNDFYGKHWFCWSSYLGKPVLSLIIQ